MKKLATKRHLHGLLFEKIIKIKAQKLYEVNLNNKQTLKGIKAKSRRI